MTLVVKKCPNCKERIPMRTEKCLKCGTTFSVTATGYCASCQQVRNADMGWRCTVCGTRLTDHQVESQVISLPQSASPAPAIVTPAPASPAPVSPAHAPSAPASSAPVSPAPVSSALVKPASPRKRAWIWWLVGCSGALCLCLLVVVAVALIARGRVSSFMPDTQPGQPAVTMAPTRPEAASSVVSIWYNYVSGSPEESALLELINRLGSQYPGIQVDAVNQNLSAGYIELYNAKVASGSGPDLLLSDSERLAVLLDAGSVVGIGSPDQPALQGIQPYALDALTRDGMLYGVPFASSTVALYYNKSMVFMPPDNTIDLLTMVQGGYPFVTNYGPYFNYGFFSAFGGQLYADNGRCIADQGGYADAMLYLRDLQAAGARFTNYGEAEDAFTSGQSSMNINGLWAYPGYRDALGSDLGAALLPSGPAGPSRPWVAVLAYYLNPNSSNREAALQVAYFLASQESTRYFIDQSFYIPVREDIPISDPVVEVFSQSAALGTRWPLANLTNNYWDPFQGMFDGVLFNGQDPQAALEQACKDMNSANGIP